MKRKLVLFMAAAFLVSNLTACKNSENTLSSEDDKSRSTQSSISESVSESTESDTVSIAEAKGEFDWDTAMDNFYIKGIKIEYPFSERTLGNDFIFEENPFYNTAGDYLEFKVDHTQSQDLWLFSAKFKKVNVKTYNNDCIVSDVKSLTEPNIQGLTEGISLDKVYLIWGKPDEIEQKHSESNYDTAIYYGNEEGQKIYLWYDNISNELLTISIDFENMKG